MVVSLYECYISWPFGVWRHRRQIDAVDLGRGEFGAEMVGDGAGAAAHIKNARWVLDRRVKDSA